MEFNYINARKNNFQFLWVLHTKRKFPLTQYRLYRDERPGLSVVEVQTNKTFVEAFFYDAVIKFMPEAWHFNIANDEIYSLDQITPTVLKTLNRDSIYGFQRRWLKLENIEMNTNNWKFSKMPTRRADFLDQQFRLVVPKKHRPDRRIHSSCFRYVLNSTFPSQDCAILHLDWILKTPKERLLKLFKYENISPGAGLGRLEYYLPEIFDYKNHQWEDCGVKEQELLNSWLKLHKSFTPKECV